MTYILLLLFFAQPIFCKVQSTEAITGHAACDDDMSLFVDGELKLHWHDWSRAGGVTFPSTALLVAIKCLDVGGFGGIKAAFDNNVRTDGSWKCSNKFEEGWAEWYFNDSLWEYATIQTHKRYKPAGLNDDVTEWIWTKGGQQDRQVYCRKRFSIVPASTKGDPCKLAKPFPNLRHRLPSYHYRLAPGIGCLQDTYIEEGWYGEPGVEIPTTPSPPSTCGTRYPAYIKLQNNGEATIYVQKNGPVKLFKTETKLCPGNYRVYNLKRIPSVCSAYCIVPANKKGDSPSYTTPVHVTVDLSTDNRFVFYCNFRQSKDKLWYTVSWYINDLPIYTSPTVENASDKQTQLLEQQIKDSGTERVGFKVQCSFRTSFTAESSQSLPSRSEHKFIGFEILTPNINLNTDHTAKLIVRPTAPIGCSNPSGDCRLDITVINSHIDSCEPIAKCTRCRMIVHSKSWNSNVTMDVNAQGTGTYINGVTLRSIRLKTMKFFFDHRVWGDATLGEIMVRINQDSTTLVGRECSAVSDPHMKTFSGHHYDHMLRGTFTLFRNVHLKQEVQIKTKSCNRNIASCICGLMIRAGRQVYEINRCEGYTNIGFKLCDEVKGIFDVSISGSSYHITFSSRTSIHINMGWEGFFDVHMYPSSMDINKSDGLCGTLGDTHGVFKNRYGRVDMVHSAQFSESWRVPHYEINLFDAGERNKLKPASIPVYPCNCPGGDDEHASIDCTNGKIKPKNCAQITKYRKSRTCKLGRRTKRHTKDQSDRTDRKSYKHVEKRDAPIGWRNGWTEEKARAFCLQHFNRSKAVQLCADVPNVDQSGPLNNCIMDIKLMGDTSFSSVGVESIKNKCYHEITSNKTLQEAASGTPSIFQQIQEVACANECSDHGVCENGTCNCEDDFRGIDCSVNIRDAPVLDHIFNDGYCTQHDDCREISVYGETFIDTGETQCKLRVETLFGNGSKQDVGDDMHAAYVESISEAVCTLPKSRKKKATVLIPEESSVKVYRISVTNDGNAFSNESVVVVFNSVCQYCNIVDVQVDCSIVDEYCVSGTKCYGNGEPLLNNDCFICSVNGSSRAWHYSEAYRCKDQTTTQQMTNTTGAVSQSTEEGPADATVSRPLWIIGVVLGAAALICLVGFGLIYKMKLIKRKFAASTVDLKKDDSTSPPPYAKEAFVN